MAGRLGAKGAAEAHDGTYRLELSGPGGGPVTLVVRGGAVRAERGAPADADATVFLPSEAGVRLLWGRLDIPAAVESGLVRINRRSRGGAGREPQLPRRVAPVLTKILPPPGRKLTPGRSVGVSYFLRPRTAGVVRAGAVLNKRRVKGSEATLSLWGTLRGLRSFDGEFDPGSG